MQGRSKRLTWAASASHDHAPSATGWPDHVRGPNATNRLASLKGGELMTLDPSTPCTINVHTPWDRALAEDIAESDPSGISVDTNRIHSELLGLEDSPPVGRLVDIKQAFGILGHPREPSNCL